METWALFCLYRSQSLVICFSLWEFIMKQLRDEGHSAWINSTQNSYQLGVMSVFIRRGPQWNTLVAFKFPYCLSWIPPTGIPTSWPWTWSVKVWWEYSAATLISGLGSWLQGTLLPFFTTQFVTLDLTSLLAGLGGLASGVHQAPNSGSESKIPVPISGYGFCPCPSDIQWWA